MGRAEELFTRIEAGGEPELDCLIQDAEAEELFLDFKRSHRNGADATLQSDDAKNLSKAISGFGNAEGGILVWGIDAPHNRGSGAPVLTKLPLVDAAAFRVRIESAISRLTVPCHPLVRNTVVFQGPGPAGFVVTIVPAARFGPLRATQPGTDRYYIRAGDSFVAIPHDALAGMFGRKPLPILWPQFVSRPVTGVMAPDARVHVSLSLSIYNKGPVLAERPYVSVHPLSDFAQRVLQVQHDGESKTERTSGIKNVQVIADQHLVVAPGGLEDMCTVHFVFGPPVPGEFRVEVTMGARDVPPILFELYASAEELTRAQAATSSAQRIDSRVLLNVPSVFPSIR